MSRDRTAPTGAIISQRPSLDQGAPGGPSFRYAGQALKFFRRPSVRRTAGAFRRVCELVSSRTGNAVPGKPGCGFESRALRSSAKPSP